MLGNSPQEIIQELNKQLEKLKTENRNLKQSQRFGIHFEHKPDDVVLSAKQNIPISVIDPSRTVAPVSEPFSIIKNSSKNPAVSHELRIGDNFLGLLTLLPKYAGKVNVIYIDPPYNTGKNDFIYNDKFVDGDDNYRHSKWLSFMEPRLKLAKKLLSNDGVIFVSIDDHEQAELKMLMDGIFGAENFVASLAISNLPSGRSLSKTFAKNHEYVLTYSGRASNFIPQISLRDDSSYNKGDENGRYRLIPLINSHKEFGPHNRPNLHYPIFIDTHGNITVEAPNNNYAQVFPKLTSGEDAIWTWGKDKLKANIRLIVAKKKQSGDYTLFRKDYLTADKKTRLKSFLDHTIMGTTAQAGRELESILGNRDFYGVKPVQYVKTLVESTQDKSAIVLDFFAGSGTTGQAVAELNAEDGGTRKCILITDEGKAKDDPDAVNIAEQITYERMRRVLTGKDWADKKEHPSLNQGLQVSHIQTIDTLLENGEPVLKPELLLEIEDLLTENIDDDSIDEDELEQLSSNIYATWRNAMRELGE